MHELGQMYMSITYSSIRYEQGNTTDILYTESKISITNSQLASILCIFIFKISTIFIPAYCAGYATSMYRNIFNYFKDILNIRLFKFIRGISPNYG